MHPEYDHLMEDAGAAPRPEPRVQLLMTREEAYAVMDWLGEPHRPDEPRPVAVLEAYRALGALLAEAPIEG